MKMLKTMLLLAVAGLLIAPPAFAKKAKSEVGKRMQHQEKRIKQGEKSGQLTKDEAKDLQADHKKIHEEIKADRAANGGKLTQEEKKDVNQQLNQESKKIHDEKHDAEKK